jgi:hypothetical protein
MGKLTDQGGTSRPVIMDPIEKARCWVEHTYQ